MQVIAVLDELQSHVEKEKAIQGMHEKLKDYQVRITEMPSVVIAKIYVVAVVALRSW